MCSILDAVAGDCKSVIRLFRRKSSQENDACLSFLINSHIFPCLFRITGSYGFCFSLLSLLRRWQHFCVLTIGRPNCPAQSCIWVSVLLEQWTTVYRGAVRYLLGEWSNEWKKLGVPRITQHARMHATRTVLWPWSSIAAVSTFLHSKRSLYVLKLVLDSLLHIVCVTL